MSAELLSETRNSDRVEPQLEAQGVRASPVPGRVAAPVLPARGASEPLGVAAVRLGAGFWGDLQRLDAAAMVPHARSWMERLGWIDNLRSAAGTARYEHRGREFADSEVYKLIEAMSWLTASGADAFTSELDELIAVVEDAQQPDGYLHTLFGRPWQRPRYSDFQWGHELYCFGHLLQAAVAHHRSTGEVRLLEVAVRLADHVCVMFGPEGLNQVCGHAEIELGLIELARETEDQRYQDQAALFVARRGTGTLPLFEFGAAYWQDDLPVRDARVLRGHAVRALYLAAGATDVAVDSGDDELLAALIAQWQATVTRRTYITGGMGSHHMDEGFGEDFVLPPDRSYCETCAGVASIMFSWRLLLATGEVRYADLIERTLFNVVAASPSRSGTEFFYANTLHQRVEHAPPPLNDDGVVIRGGSSGRQAWYEVSCCPPNVARTLGSLSAYIASVSGGDLVIHQFAAAQIVTEDWEVDVDTAYPAEGRVRVQVRRCPEGGRLVLRVPEWAGSAEFMVDGVTAAASSGYEPVEVASGSVVELGLPLTVRVGPADDRVDAVRGCVAVQRGPLVMALESVDLPEGWLIEDVLIDPASAQQDDGTVSFSIEHVDRQGPGRSLAPTVETKRSDAARVPLVPYYDWAERGPSTMRVWIPRK